MSRFFLSAGCISAGLAVILGAFGAHSLKERLGPQMLAVFETGVRYQMYHALALLALGLVGMRIGPGSARSLRPLTLAGQLFIAGTVLFSGSLYLLTLTGARWLGAVTPFGGLSLIAGWSFFLVGILRSGRAE
jgi:uncharacterized membrane protein YgdD (TMEM256/DUF423 family)